MPESFKPVIRRFSKSILAFAFALLFTNINAIAAPDGKAIFSANCASCHNPLKDATGPALQNVDKHPHGRAWIYNWVKNPAAVLASGDAHANELKAKYGTVMTAFPQLGKEEIDAVLDYVNAFKAPTAPGPVAGAAAADTEDNTWLYAVITIVLLLLVIVLWRANAGLRQAAYEKDGGPAPREIPVYRNKAFIAVFAIVVFIAMGYWITNGAVEMGRQQNYQPEQPIFYSHKVHAGINQINCLYCHAGAEKSKHAMIPSSNVCMNCHKQIGEYTGEQLFNAEGKKVNGTMEIQKLYNYAGWNPEKKAYNMDKEGNIMAKPIKWAKIHNLPDHVYFNHSQHVKVGQVQCQRCHGQIQEMDEVYQFAPLSMGWCINCHRQTEVKFTDNKYYGIYERFHKEIKEGKRSKVTVEDIGGIECQKCHY